MKKKTEEEILKEKGLTFGFFDKDGNLIELQEAGMVYDKKDKKWHWIDWNGNRIKEK